MNWTVLASLMDRFSRWWSQSGPVAFLLDVSAALDTADREVLERAGVEVCSCLCFPPVSGGGRGR